MKTILIILSLLATAQVFAAGFICNEDHRRIELRHHQPHDDYSFVLVTKPPISSAKRILELASELKCHFSQDVRFVNCTSQSARLHANVKGGQVNVEIHRPLLEADKTSFHFDVRNCVYP